MSLERYDITTGFVTLERSHFLARSLDSLGFTQRIIYDNGTQNPVAKFQIKARAHTQAGKYIRSEKNEGLPKAWNQCIINAQTDWVILCPDDVIFRRDWIEDVNKILDHKPNTKIIFGNNYDMIMLHKSIIPVVGWLDERYKQYPSSEDYDFHLRLVEIIGFSPYTMPGDHVQGPEREKRLRRKTTREQYFSEKNFTYWCTSEFSIVPPLCTEIPHPKTANYFQRDPNQETGYDFHAKKWQVCEEGEKGALLNIDGQYWKRLIPDVDPYPEITEQYRRKYEK
jgi:glycosyltransferase involved in cell wall biosynthesis